MKLGSRALATSIFALTVGAATPAVGAPITLDVCNVSGLCGFVFVEATPDAGAVDISVTSPADFGLFGGSGASRAFGFNVKDPDAGVTISNLTPQFSVGGTNVMLGGGFGTFDFVINGPQQGAHALLPLAFTVDRPGGFLTLADFFEANAAGFLFGVHVRNNDTGLTGFAGTSHVPNPVVPEPSTLMLLGTGFAALAGFASRRRSRLDSV